MSPATLVLDSYALIAYLERERGAEIVLRCIEQAHRKAVHLLLNLIN